jgi:V/A-type H+-transporting ATPase subunit I
MTKYSFILLNGEQEGLLEKLQETGLMDITRSVKPVDSNTESLLERYRDIDQTVARISNIQIPETTLAVPAAGEDLLPYAKSVLSEYSALQEKLREDRKEDAAVKVWGKFSKEDLDLLERHGLKLHFHKVSAKAFKEEWASEFPLKVIEKDKTGVYFVVVGESTLPGEIKAPKYSSEDLQWQISELEAGLATAQGRIKGLKDSLPDLEAQGKSVLEELDLALAGAAAVPAAENTIVTLVGYAPTDKREEVSAGLDSLGVFYFAQDAVAEENPPIAFRNNKFVKMFETLTDMYGRPAYDGFDPTPFISVFFLLFFAFCMGDAGYGLVLVLLGLLLRKKIGDLAPLVVTLGLGTVVIGFLFHTFFSIDISKWQIFQPIKGIFLPAQIAGNDATMVLSLVVGVVHICLAMVVKTIHETRTKGFYASLGTWGWTLLVVGGVIVAAFALAGVLDAALTKWIVIVLGVVSALGIFVFNDPKRNKFANIGMGLWDTYNMITGLVGDVLSYIRLYALGLAGSMLGMAFNDMGVMILGDSPNIGKWLGFLFLVIFGHTLNIAMCALGAFVHPLRLNFLEFFKNSGYEATGRIYNPLKKSLNK